MNKEKQLRKDSIIAVADAIEFGEIPFVGYSHNTYFNAVNADKDIRDMSGRERPFVADIAGYAVALFFFDGGKRQKPLDHTGLSEVINQTPTTLIEIVARIFGITEDQALELIASEDFAPEKIRPNQAVGALHTLAETGEVKWFKDYVIGGNRRSTRIDTSAEAFTEAVMNDEPVLGFTDTSRTPSALNLWRL